MAGLAAGESPWRSVLLFKMSQVRCVESVVGPKSADVTTVCYLAKFRPAHMYIPLYISARLHVRVCMCVCVVKCRTKTRNDVCSLLLKFRKNVKGIWVKSCEMPRANGYF